MRMTQNDHEKQFVAKILSLESELRARTHKSWSVPGTEGRNYYAAASVFNNLTGEVVELDRLAAERADAEAVIAQADKVEGSIRTLSVLSMLTISQADALVDELHTVFNGMKRRLPLLYAATGT
jgi:hypothetical protein